MLLRVAPYASHVIQNSRTVRPTRWNGVFLACVILAAPTGVRARARVVCVCTCVCVCVCVPPPLPAGAAGHAKPSCTHHLPSILRTLPVIVVIIGKQAEKSNLNAVDINMSTDSFQRLKTLQSGEGRSVHLSKHTKTNLILVQKVGAPTMTPVLCPGPAPAPAPALPCPALSERPGTALLCSALDRPRREARARAYTHTHIHTYTHTHIHTTPVHPAIVCAAHRTPRHATCHATCHAT